MSLFDQLVTQAMSTADNLAPLRTVVEKELLHHDILREMSAAGLLRNLVFIGGTCLRLCYGSHRLSEDLDFTGGSGFQAEDLQDLSVTLIDGLQVKYGLTVEISTPVRSPGKVSTWKLRVTTNPYQKHLPVQRIHIDICAIPSHDPVPMVLRNHYGVNMGTSGLILQAQSREEILADKVIALTLRPNRMKNRDLWDIGWLNQQNVGLSVELVAKKIVDRGLSTQEFISLLDSRSRLLVENRGVQAEFIGEMRRFLPPETMAETVARDDFWQYLSGVVNTESQILIRKLERKEDPNGFRM